MNIKIIITIIIFIIMFVTCYMILIKKNEKNIEIYYGSIKYIYIYEYNIKKNINSFFYIKKIFFFEKIIYIDNFNFYIKKNNIYKHIYIYNIKKLYNKQILLNNIFISNKNKMLLKSIIINTNKKIITTDFLKIIKKHVYTINQNINILHKNDIKNINNCVKIIHNL